MGIAQVQHLLDVEVGLEPYRTGDQYGGGTYGAKRMVKAHIQDARRDMASFTDQALPAEFKIILGEAIQVDPRDRLTLPKEYGTRSAEGTGEFVEATAKIVSVRPVYFRGKHDHTVIICGAR